MDVRCRHLFFELWASSFTPVPTAIQGNTDPALRNLPYDFRLLRTTIMFVPVLTFSGPGIYILMRAFCCFPPCCRFPFPPRMPLFHRSPTMISLLRSDTQISCASVEIAPVIARDTPDDHPRKSTRFRSKCFRLSESDVANLNPRRRSEGARSHQSFLHTLRLLPKTLPL